jgi:hypothetical protein
MHDVMSDDPLKDAGQGPPSDSADGHDAGSALPRPLQEHLAQQLRSTYQTVSEKPAFLGDPAIPAEFEHHLQRLEAVETGRRREKVHTQAVEAVKNALEDIVGEPIEGDGLPPDERSRPADTP